MSAPADDSEPRLSRYAVSLTLDLHPLPDYVHATLSGEYTYDELKQAIGKMMTTAYEQPLPGHKLLVDCLGITGNPTLRERFDLVAFALQQRINAILNGKRPRVVTAVVAAPPFAHPNRYGIRLVIERNLKITVCATVEEAQTWLGVDNRGSPAAPAA